jgi:transcription elongation factor Elf1
MTEAEPEPEHEDDAPPSEVVFLPTVVCPKCGRRNVVVEIEVGRTPVLSCTGCGHSSRPPDLS